MIADFSYLLKRSIMTRIINKRTHQHPFDYAYAEQYSLEGVTDRWVNNSYYFSAHDGQMSIYARLGQRVDAAETWFVIYMDGQVYSLQEEVFSPGNSPLCVLREGDRWVLRFDGKVNDGTHVKLSARFAGTQRPIDFTSDMPAVRMATGIANETWNKDLFNRLQQVSGQCHYEQEGVLTGEVQIDGRTRTFSLPCVRDHSFGKRDWNYMNNHLWLMAVSPNGQFNYSMVSYPAMSVLEVGSLRDEKGLHLMQQADLDLQLVAQGSIPQKLDFMMHLNDGRAVRVCAEVLTGVTYHFQNGQYILHENIASFTIDGQPYRGILEIGFNSDADRYFNQRPLNTIHR